MVSHELGTTATESHATSIVHVTNNGCLSIVVIVVYGCTTRVAVFSTTSYVEVHQPTLVHTLLHGKVEYSFFFTIVDTGQASSIRLLVVSLDAVDHFYRQVLQTCSYVATKEFLTAYQELAYLLTIDFNVTAIINFCTRKLTHQFFEHSTLWCTISSCVIQQCIFRYLYLSSFSSYHGFFQHNGIGFQCNSTDVSFSFVGSEFQWQNLCFKTYIRKFQCIIACSSLWQCKCTIDRSSSTINIGTVWQ